MTDHELAAIDEVSARAQQSNGMAAGHDVAMIHAPALVAEVRRLRAELGSLELDAKVAYDEGHADGYELAAGGIP